MRSSSVAILFLLLVVKSIEASTNCDIDVNSRRLSQKNHRVVKFKEANVKGEDYIRPKGKSNLHVVSSTDSIISEEGGDNYHYSEQIHLTLGSSTSSSVIISYTNMNINTTSQVEYSTNMRDLMKKKKNSNVRVAVGTATSYSQLIYVSAQFYNPSMGSSQGTMAEVIKMENTSVWARDSETGEHWANYRRISAVDTGLQSDSNPYAIYDSPMIFQVKIDGLTPGQTYYYRVSGSCDIYHFTYPKMATKEDTKSVYPFKMGLTADVGQTFVSSASFDALIAMKPDLVLLAGDLSYADGWIALWDSFGNLIQKLAAFYPILTTGGNHELGSAEAWLSYMQRYPTPHESSGSPHFCYWGREVGPVHIIALCSYAGFSSTSLQYSWLSNYLASKINRIATPWLVVMMHAPWYNTNYAHWMEGELMRQSMEPLLNQYGVDIVISGHVHSYERTYPVNDNKIDSCGTMYLNLGDGGNYENAYTDWRASIVNSWSAFREASFGVGELVIHNSTHAYYAWHRHACGSDDPQVHYMNFSDSCVTPGDESNQRMLTSDTIWFIRPMSTECYNHWISTSNEYVGSFFGYSLDQEHRHQNSGDNLSLREFWLILVCSFLGLMNILLVLLYINRTSLSCVSSSSITSSSHNRAINSYNIVSIETSNNPVMLSRTKYSVINSVDSEML